MKDEVRGEGREQNGKDATGTYCIGADFCSPVGAGRLRERTDRAKSVTSHLDFVIFLIFFVFTKECFARL
jgi:hypothetical protein